MEVKLYQINLDRDEEGLAFMGQDYLSKKKDDPTRIDSQIYDCVFDGEIEGSSLEDAFATFNFDHPDGFKGRSMSVSDVVICATDGGAPAAYFCDSIGFRQVQFDEELAKTLQTEMTVVLLEPGKMARVATIDSSLEGMQKVVGGLIEPFYPFDEPVCIICNEEGKLNSMPLNRAIYAEPEEIDMSYSELRSQFYKAEEEGKHISGYVVFSQDSFKDPYSEVSRTYVISSDNKAFQAGMGGYSIYGYCLDGTDPCVRLDRYMAVEHGGADGWKIERCYMKSDARQMIDIIAGPCFICDCSGEDFGSLTAEQLQKYTEQFKYPEHFFRVGGEIKAVPYPPEKNQER